MKNPLLFWSMERDFESYPEFEFVDQDIDDDIKLQMLFAELNRLERTIEIHGHPFVFVDDDEVRYSVDSGKERFEVHRRWLEDLLCEKSWSSPNSTSRRELLRSVLNRIQQRNVHPYILLILAEIVVVGGIKSFCAEVQATG